MVCSSGVRTALALWCLFVRQHHLCSVLIGLSSVSFSRRSWWWSLCDVSMIAFRMLVDIWQFVPAAVYLNACPEGFMSERSGELSLFEAARSEISSVGALLKTARLALRAHKRCIRVQRVLNFLYVALSTFWYDKILSRKDYCRKWRRSRRGYCNLRRIVIECFKHLYSLYCNAIPL